jgi:putative MATE family efflux protein
MRQLSLTTDPIPQLTWRIALPTSVGMFFNTLYNFTDTYCAGFLGTNALAALAFTFPVFFLLISVASGLGQGTTALVANALGKGDKESAASLFAQALLVAVGAGFVLLLVGWFLAPWLLFQLGAKGKTLELAVEYLRVIMLGGVFFILLMGMNSALSAQGETRFYRNFLIFGFFANLGLNPLFIWGLVPGIPALGVGGIAIATVIVQAIGCLILWWHVRNTPAFLDMPWSAFAPNPQRMREILSQSIPAMLNMATIAMGVFVITYFVKSFGDEAVAAVGIATRIEQLILMPAIGLSSALLSITGQNFGAGLPHRISEALRTVLKQSCLCMLFGAVLLFIGGKWMIQIFTDDAKIIQHGRDYLVVAAVTLAAYPILFATVFMMQGLKKPSYGLWVGLYRQIVAPILVFYAFAYLFAWGLWGIWWGIFLVNWSAALFAVYWGRRVLARLPTS